MRINAYLARATGLSRRSADQAIAGGRVMVNGHPATIGQTVSPSDRVTIDGNAITISTGTLTIMLNKPTGYVCSRQGQGSKTVYDLLPAKYHGLKPIGRLDKDSSGLLLLTNDGTLANRLTHPRYGKHKVYEVGLDRPLEDEDDIRLAKGVQLDDGPSRLRIRDRHGLACTVIIGEGRNRQVRRSFAALGYTVTKLHRVRLGDYRLPSDLAAGACKPVPSAG